MTDSDNDLLRALYDQYGSALLFFAMRLTGGDRAKSEDVVQETLLRAWRNPSVLHESQGSARAWLFTVARRIVIDEWRAVQRHEQTGAEALPEPAVADAADRSVDRQLVVTALRRLSAQHREVLLECYFRGASVAEAAARLGVPPGTVKSRCHYALGALRLALEEIGEVR